MNLSYFKYFYCPIPSESLYSSLKFAYELKGNYMSFLNAIKISLQLKSSVGLSDKSLNVESFSLAPTINNKLWISVSIAGTISRIPLSNSNNIFTYYSCCYALKTHYFLQTYISMLSMNTHYYQEKEKKTMKDNQIDHYLKILSLHQIREIYKEEAENAAKAKLDYLQYLQRLLEQQVFSKIERSINRRMQIAGFPKIKRLEEFDFSYQPKINEKLIRQLANLDFLIEAKNIIFLGPPGVGKTHLAISIGIKACQERKRVLFYTAETLTDELAAAEVSGQLNTKLTSLSNIYLLIIDELGYLSLTNHTAKLFFQLIAKRYEKGSIIITSNKLFEQWGEIFNDEVVASAILDRLLHHCYPFLINGKSFRLKNMEKFT